MDFSNRRKRLTKRMPKKVSNWVFLCFQLGNFIFPVRKFHFSREAFFAAFWGFFVISPFSTWTLSRFAPFRQQIAYTFKGIETSFETGLKDCKIINNLTTSHSLYGITSPSLKTRFNTRNTRGYGYIMPFFGNTTINDLFCRKYCDVICALMPYKPTQNRYIHERNNWKVALESLKR